MKSEAVTGEASVEVPMIEGVADINCILFVAGGVTVITALLLLDEPVAVAVIVSVPLPQPLSL